MNMKSKIERLTRRNWKKVLSALPFYLFTLLPLNAQTQISEYKPGVTPEGAVYFLPKTAVRFTMLVEKTTYTPGDFCMYAQRFMRLKDVSQEPSTSYRIINIKQVPIAVADTTKGFAVKFDAKTVAANVKLADDGRLLGINADAKDYELPVPFEPGKKIQQQNPRELLNQEILSAGSTAKMAELTAQEIYDLRENRNLLIKGQADFMPKDGEQLRLMLNQIDTQDKTLTRLFNGTYDCDTTEFTLTVCPNSPVHHLLLFRLSQVNGLVDTDDLSGSPFYVDIDNLNAVPPVDDEEAAKAKKKKPYEAGIYVNVPGRMRVTLYQGITAIDKQEHPAPQFGNVELLSGELFNKRYTTHLWINPLTGAVLRLEGEQPK